MPPPSPVSAPLQWLPSRGTAQRSLDAALHDASTPRGFEGALRNLRTPHGLATITSGPEGLAIRLQGQGQ